MNKSCKLYHGTRALNFPAIYRDDPCMTVDEKRETDRETAAKEPAGTEVRRERLARRLRENLRRRKEQDRLRRNPAQDRD